MCSERACRFTAEPLLEFADRYEHTTATADETKVRANVLVEEVS
jgi:hypothetical protein